MVQGCKLPLPGLTEEYYQSRTAIAAYYIIHEHYIVLETVLFLLKC